MSRAIAECDICGKLVVASDVNNHRTTAHGESVKTECAYCGELFHADHSDQEYCKQTCENHANYGGGPE